MNTTSTHVVLGGNGVAGRETVRALLERGISPASVGRTHSHIPEVESIIADLLDPDAVHSALRGADVAYLTAGLPYSARIWEREWPIIVANCIDAAISHSTLLVYLDNVYAYGHVEGAMTEASVVRPGSRKGEVRATALSMLKEAADSRGLVHAVGRSADFYGPGATTSVFNMLALDKVAAGGKPTWLVDATQPHSLTYTPDMGAALAVLGTDPRAVGSSWHLPTAAPALTGAQYMDIATGGDGKHQTMGSAMMRIGALFNKSARESLEMAYQYTSPYVFDSSAFESTFGMAPTSYEVGIDATLRASRDAR